MTKQTPEIYGALPKDLGVHEFGNGEMMFWLYCPVKMPLDVGFRLPSNLAQFDKLLDLVRRDVSRDFGMPRWVTSYVYLTAKTLYVSPQSPGNRLGWHSDGFLTDDLNYIWADRNPTLFFDAGTCRIWSATPLYSVPADHSKALVTFDMLATKLVADEKIVTYPDRTLLRLDQTVIHAVNPKPTSGIRTFLKVSVSDKPYALKGNSINHLLPQHPLPTEARQAERNHPQGNTKEAA